MRDGSSTHPESTSPETTIPGWRLILSDAGRLWATREKPFSQVAAHAEAERTVDGDTLEALRAETDRQETFARETEEQAAREKEAEEAPAPEKRGPEAREQEAPVSEAQGLKTREQAQAGQVIA